MKFCLFLAANSFGFIHITRLKQCKGSGHSQHKMDMNHANKNKLTLINICITRLSLLEKVALSVLQLLYINNNNNYCFPIPNRLLVIPYILF